MIASRKFRSTPFRDSSETWAAIVQLLTHANEEAKRELELVAGTASRHWDSEAVTRCNTKPQSLIR